MPTPTPLSDEDLHDRFFYHPPSEEGIERHADLSEWFYVLAMRCRDMLGTGRELSLVLTKLEEAKFFASAAVARNPETR